MSIAIDHYSVLHLSFVVRVHSSIDQKWCGEVCRSFGVRAWKFFSGVNFFVYGLVARNRNAIEMTFDRAVVPGGRARIKV